MSLDCAPLLSSTRKRASACRVLFPEAAAAANGQASPSSCEMRLRPVLMPSRKRAAASSAHSAAAPTAAAAVDSSSNNEAPELPSTSQPVQQLQQQPEEAPPTLQQPLPSFATSFTSLLYNPAPAQVWQPAFQPLYVCTDYSYFPVPYYPAPGYAPVLAIEGFPPAPAASCFYTPEPYGPNAAKRGCF